MVKGCRGRAMEKDRMNEKERWQGQSLKDERVTESYGWRDPQGVQKNIKTLHEKGVSLKSLWQTLLQIWVILVCKTATVFVSRLHTVSNCGLISNGNLSFSFVLAYSAIIFPQVCLICELIFEFFDQCNYGLDPVDLSSLDYGLLSNFATRA
ncbi:hypothetical protein E3U43_020319 [Larimichthys crocea]|uniref:Uncharacterized protein n=1 Tax=Larimichthys crocea TaxID=215358 RepID=A0ACD3QXA9_LARCR|nr:hypothetical protein E3U43_020319 [Larimichthys crocea]